jgi:hypothetical protein
MSRADFEEIGREIRRNWGQRKRVCGCGSVWGERGFKGSKKVQTRLTALVQ